MQKLVKWMLMTGMLFNAYSVCYAVNSHPASQNENHQKPGSQLWIENCSRCHNYRSPTEFTPNQWGTIMMHMRFQAGITGNEAKEILSYLTQSSLSEFGNEANPSGTPGQKIYQRNCVGCHGITGKGTGPTFPDFTKKDGVLAKSDNVLLNNVIHGIGAMPPKGGNSSLSNDDVKAALAYIKSTFGSK